MSPAVVIGGGLGGLSAAIHLRVAGHDVLLLEKNATLGGKCNHMEWEGFQFDTGPSLLTLPHILDGVFTAAGKNRADYLELIRLAPACRYTFADGTRFDAPGDIDGFRAAVAKTFPEDCAALDKFLRDGQTLWDISGPMFLFNRFRLSNAFRVGPLKALRGLSALMPQSLEQALKKQFRDPRLIQLFSRYATYNGSDPVRTPATFNVIAHAEMAYGSWHCMGGMVAMVRALEKLARDIGVDIQTETEVASLAFSSNGKAVTGLTLVSGEQLQTSRVVINADAITALTGSLLAEHPQAVKWQNQWSKKEASSSGYVLLLALDKQVDGLACHNIFFNQNYRDEFRDLFGSPQPLQDPTIYVSIPGKVDHSQAPAGKEAWFVLVNAPSLDRFDQWQESYTDFLLDKMERVIPGFDRSGILWQKALPPTFLKERYHAWHGSIYGPSSNNQRDAFFRVPNRSSIKGLSFTGGSAHPGGGIPLVLTSGRLAAECLGRPN
ncbi:MAG: phytoene desaturase family protein [Verrucomicrobiota bacterium]